MLNKLQKILDEVHRGFTYRSDLETFGKLEHWATPDELGVKFQGDCDDFATMCVGKCRDAGFPARFLYCKTPTGYHLVCEVDGYILDNCYKHVMYRNELPYRWISISGVKPGDAWREVVA